MYIWKIEIYRKADRALKTDYICKEQVYIRVMLNIQYPENQEYFKYTCTRVFPWILII